MALVAAFGLVPVASLPAFADANCAASFDGQCAVPPYELMEQAAVAADVGSALPTFPLNTGIGGVDQFDGFTTAMLTQYEAKLQRLQAVVASDPAAAVNIAEGLVGSVATNASTATSSNCAEGQCPPPSASINEGAMIEPDGYCGPTSAANAVWALNQNSYFSGTQSVYDIANDMGEGSYDANAGIDRGGWDKNRYGTNRGGWRGEMAINDYSNGQYGGSLTNAYSWANVDSSGLWNDTVADIWGGVAPIYNISSVYYTKDNNGHSHANYPLPQYPSSYNSGRPIYHYFPAYGYQQNYVVDIFDENNFLSQHFWRDSASQLYLASVGNGQYTGAQVQILW
ncbi:MAG TPA: hypothetical protein VFC09_16540 [Candidatus Dormibacteraeota bacterium]|nr:hypothetical protein [Candidatus Dormibacteraeota bacterium]